MKQNTALSYEQFMEQASEQLAERFQIDYLKSADGETTDEQHFYGNCKYWESELSNELKTEITATQCGANLHNDNVRDVQSMSLKLEPFNILDLSKEDLIKVIGNIHDSLGGDYYGHGHNTEEIRALSKIGSAATDLCVKQIGWDITNL